MRIVSIYLSGSWHVPLTSRVATRVAILVAFRDPRGVKYCCRSGLGFSSVLGIVRRSVEAIDDDSKGGYAACHQGEGGD